LWGAELVLRVPEKQDIAVRVSHFKAAQAIVSVLERRAKRRAGSGKVGGKSVRVRRKDKGVPP
jgi:hypothetical protein